MTVVGDPRGGHHPVEIRLCSGSGCVALGALEVLEAIRRQAADAGLEVMVHSRLGFVGCRGFCSQGPLVYFPGLDVLYCRVGPGDVDDMLRVTVGRGELVDRLLYADPASGERCRGLADNPFFVGQHRQVLGRCGTVDPEDLDHAVSLGAYAGLRGVIADGDPESVIDLVKRTGLQERSGAGFPVGLKWAVVAESSGQPKAVIGNGEDGDPGMTVSRTLLEGDPHSIVEGMVIAAFAVGARVGRLVVRSDHELGVARAERAVTQARHRGFVGSGVCGSNFDFEIEVCEDAGASMSGEETALINVLQGRRGVARPRPPFPTVRGLWGRPTLISNLETLANVPLIVSDAGTGGDAGRTRVVGLSGRVRRAGLAEIPLNAKVSEAVIDIGGGCSDGELRAVHVGGLGGVSLRPDQLETVLDFAAIRDLGGHLSSGGLVVLGEHDCPVALAMYLVGLCAEESCGTCPPCRIGTEVVLGLFERLENGAADAADLERLERLCRHIGKTSLCEHGRNAARSVLASLVNFRKTYEAHLTIEGCPDSGRRPPESS